MTPSQKKEINSEILKVEKKLLSFIEKELDKVKALSESMETTAEKLKKHYAQAFPKKCNNCGKLYNNIDDFLRATLSMEDLSTIFDEGGLQEYRNCVCGSTLLLLTDDRRDKSEAGAQKRKLFHDSLLKLCKSSDFSKEDLRLWLRAVFSKLEKKD